MNKSQNLSPMMKKSIYNGKENKISNFNLDGASNIGSSNFLNYQNNFYNAADYAP